MKKNKEGLSIIETLIVIVVFSLLAVVVGQSVALSLRGARKSDSLSEVRENIDFAVSIVERQLRNARSVTSICNGNPIMISGNPGISFEDENELPATISCASVGTNGYLQNSTGRLTNSSVSITACRFSCVQSSEAVPPVISLNITGSKKSAPQAESSSITVDTIIRLRVY